MEIARYIRSQRRAQKLPRDALVDRSTVPAPTIKRCEFTGEISFRQLYLLWETLGYLGRLKALCDVESMPSSIEEVLAGAKGRR